MSITPNYSCDCLIKIKFEGGDGNFSLFVLFSLLAHCSRLIVSCLFLVLIFGKHDRVPNAYKVHMCSLAWLCRLAS